MTPGKLADLTILDADPAAGLTNFARVRAVVRSGKPDLAALVHGPLAPICFSGVAAHPIGLGTIESPWNATDATIVKANRSCGR